MDIDLDSRDHVIVNGKGMSVNPDWRNASLNRVPRRLRNLVPGAAGPNNHYCFCHGTGPFEPGPVAEGLRLEPDSDTHGNITPAQAVPLSQYEADIAATRPGWQVDET
jgi:hypothetical protein